MTHLPRKIAAVSAAAVLAFTLAACGGDDTDNAGDDPSTSATPTPTEAVPTEEPTEAVPTEEPTEKPTEEPTEEPTDAVPTEGTTTPPVAGSNEKFCNAFRSASARSDVQDVVDRIAKAGPPDGLTDEELEGYEVFIKKAGRLKINATEADAKRVFRGDYAAVTAFLEAATTMCLRDMPTDRPSAAEVTPAD